MNRQERKDLYAATSTAAELVVQRIMNKSKNKSSEEILRSPKLFADNTLNVTYKISKKWTAINLIINLKNYQGLIYKGKYQVTDPNVSTKNILDVIWHDIISALYKHYGVSY